MFQDNPRMQTVWSVLEGAKDCGDTMVTQACRRLITANRLGWRKHHDPADYALVLGFHHCTTPRVDMGWFEGYVGAQHAI